MSADRGGGGPTTGQEVPVRRRFEPPESDAGAPFWAGSRERELRIPWCEACGRPHWFPREGCPHCLSNRIEWRPASGEATVYACSVMPKPAMPMLADRVPYVVALVELAEGVRMLTNIVGVDDPFKVSIGDAVTLRWEELTDGRHLPVFTPAATPIQPPR